MRRLILSLALLIFGAPAALGATPVKPKPPPKTPATKPLVDAIKQAPGATIFVNDKAKLNLELTDHTKFTASDAKGKIVLLYFWMSTDPSINQIPELIELQAKYIEGGFVLIGINGDKDLETMQATVKKN